MRPRNHALAVPIELPDELRLTQYGERPPFGDGFRDRLRKDIGETEISMILGEVRMALSEDMPPSRRQIVYTTSEAIRELATASA
jgi:hypothetical protein